ncbi:hypothetical protein [Pseudomonas zhanjiangensis]|uniref:Uncharacterized protein n=1 Tax=Pseudomonas zhanjiangensis TaxID=3239015 RepID=A0ABV3YVJ0_9PSED
MLKLKSLIKLSFFALMLSSVAMPQLNLLVDSAYAKGGGGGGGGGGGNGGNGGGNGGGHGGGHGAGVGGGRGHADGGVGGKGKGVSASAGHGAATSEAAKSKDTTGLAKAMSVVSTTPAALAAAFGLQNAFASSSKDDGETEGTDEGTSDEGSTDDGAAEGPGDDGSVDDGGAAESEAAAVE